MEIRSRVKEGRREIADEIVPGEGGGTERERRRARGRARRTLREAFYTPVSGVGCSRPRAMQGGGAGENDGDSWGARSMQLPRAVRGSASAVAVDRDKLLSRNTQGPPG